MRTGPQAIAAAKRTKTNRYGMCQNQTWNWFQSHAVGDVDHDGDADAVDGWLSEPVSARHTDRKPWIGAPGAWSGGSSGNGHRALCIGYLNGEPLFRSTDGRGRGLVGNHTLGWFEKHWGLKWLGWSSTMSGVPIDGLAPPPGVKKPDPKKPGPSTGKLPTDAVDGSHWNVFTVNGMKLARKAGVTEYWFKCTEGVDFIDGSYDQNRATAKKAGRRSSAYHFGRPRVSGGAAQARFFLSHAKIVPGTDLEIMLDLEDNGGLSRAALTKWVGDFMADIFDHLGPKQLIYTNFDLDKNFGCYLWVARYHNGNALPRVPEPWKSQGELWKIRQFSNGVYGNPHSVPGLEKVDLNNIVGDKDVLVLPKGKPKPPPDPIDPPKPPPNSVDFRVHLAPGNKAQTADQVEHDMRLALKMSHTSAIVISTERERPALRTAVSTGLGKGWKRVHDNENTQAFGPSWTVDEAHLEAITLAKADPYKEGVSPTRKLDVTPVTHDRLKAVELLVKSTHLTSEANCIHIHVKARKWREKTWDQQVLDILDDCEKDFKAGKPQVVVGDFNVGSKRVNGKELFAMFQKRFGKYVTHVHNGGLDQMFTIGTPEVKMGEVGVDFNTNNTSDHDMVTATIRMQKL